MKENIFVYKEKIRVACLTGSFVIDPGDGISLFSVIEGYDFVLDPYGFLYVRF